MRIVKNMLVIAFAGIIAFTGVGCNMMKDTPALGKFVKLKDDDLLRIGATVCKVDEARLVLMNLQNQYKNDFGGQITWSQEMGNTTFENFVRDKVQSELSIVYAMSAIAQAEEITISEEEQKLIDKAAEEYYDSLNDAERDYAKASVETISSLYRNYYLADKVYEQKTEAVSDEISDEEARVMKIQYIYIDTSETSVDEAKETLAQVKKQVENGYQDFLVQANKYSDSTPVERTLRKNEADEEYELKAFELTDGVISDVIEDVDGVYLVKCVNSYLEKQTQKNKNQVMLNNKIVVFEKIYNSYVKDSKSDFNEKAWEKVGVSKDESVAASNLFEVYDKYMIIEG